MTEDRTVRIYRRTPEDKAKYLLRQLANIDVEVLSKDTEHTSSEWVQFLAVWASAKAMANGGEL